MIVTFLIGAHLPHRHAAMSLFHEAMGRVHGHERGLPGDVMVRVQSSTDAQAADERSAASRVSRWCLVVCARSPERSK
eukprot:3857505-Prymnesium_polylepis.1